MSGVDLVADGLTKPLLGQSFQRFQEKLCLVGERAEATAKKAIVEVNQSLARHPEWSEYVTMALAAVGGALIASGRWSLGCAVLIGLVAGKKFSQALPATVEGDQSREDPKVKALRVTLDVNVAADQGQLPVPPRQEQHGDAPRGEDASAMRGYGSANEVGDPWRQFSEGFRVLEPWRLECYQEEPRSLADKWDLSLWSQGWLVRVHGGSRKELFNPRRASLTCSVDQLESLRVSSMIKKASREVMRDDWHTTGRWSEETAWTGYTFLQRVSEHGDEENMVRSSGVASSRRSGSSYELVEERP